MVQFVGYSARIELESVSSSSYRESWNNDEMFPTPVQFTENFARIELEPVSSSSNRESWNNDETLPSPSSVYLVLCSTRTRTSEFVFASVLATNLAWDPFQWLRGSVSLIRGWNAVITFSYQKALWFVADTFRGFTGEVFFFRFPVWIRDKKYILHLVIIVHMIFAGQGLSKDYLVLLSWYCLTRLLMANSTSS